MHEKRESIAAKPANREPAAIAEAAQPVVAGGARWLGALGLVALAATVVVAPMFFLGNVSGHDFLFHIASWMDAAGQWREGILYPRWAEWANWGFGEPRFIFYPPASWMLGAALGSLLPWNFAPMAFIWLTLTASGMAMWRLARAWLSAPQAAAAAVLFAVNPYHLVIVYYRSDFAELLAGALLPLLVLSAARLAGREWKYAPWVAICFAGIWLSNAPAGVIATYSLVVLAATACVVRREAWPAVSCGAGMAGGFGLAAIYILPAALERGWVQIGEAISQNLHPAQNFLFTRASDPEFLLFNWKVSAVAMVLMLFAGIAAVLSARKRAALGEIWPMLLALGAAATLVMFRPSLPLWEHLPELQFVQFPWRWLEPLALVFASFAAAATDFRAAGERPTRDWQPWAATCAVLAVFAAAGTLMARDTWWYSTDAEFIADSIAAGHGYDGVDEYAPVGCDRYELPGYMPDSDTPSGPVQPAPRVAKLDEATGKIVAAAGVRLHVEKWSADEKRIDEEAAKPVTLAIRVVSYPAWQVRVDGARVASSAAPTTDEMLVSVPAGKHEVDARFGRTRDRVAGGIISALSAIGLVGVVWLLQRRGNG